MRMYESSAALWRDVDVDDLAPATEGWMWLDVGHEDFGHAEAVCRALKLPAHAIVDILEPTEYPKLHEYEQAAFAISHSPALVEERFTTSELDIYLTDQMLVTFHRDAIPGVGWTMDRDLASYGGPAEAMADVLEAGAQRYLALIDGLGQQVEELEAMAIAGNPEVLGRVQALRRDAIVLRSLLAPERDMIRALSRVQLQLGRATRRQLESVYDDYFRIVESLDTARALLGAVLDTYRSTVAERTNEVMKVLTVFSAIFLPLALIAGVYGMNFANMPELQWEWGYFILIGVMLAVAVGLWIYFAWRGFIGGPKLWRVDRVIGRGLGAMVHLTTAPIRGVRDLLITSDDDDDG